MEVLAEPTAAAHEIELASASLADLAERATGYAAQASGAGTQRAYQSAWRAYAGWCAKIGHAPLSGDAGLLALYLTKRADDGLAVSSIKIARAAIIAAHRLTGLPLDAADRRLAMVMEGIVRNKAGCGTRQAAPAVPDVLRRLLAALPVPNTPKAAAPALAARHRAMLLIGFGAALRRSEIVALTIGDVAAETRGLTVRVRRSKTDQHGHGKRIAIWANHRDPAFCPVAAFAMWMGFRKLAADLAPRGGSPFHASPDPAERPLFCGVTLGGRIAGMPMSDKIVARLIKQACVHAGLDPKKFSGHSLRRGLLTNAGDLLLTNAGTCSCRWSTSCANRATSRPTRRCATSRMATRGATTSPSRCFGRAEISYSVSRGQIASAFAAKAPLRVRMASSSQVPCLASSAFSAISPYSCKAGCLSLHGASDRL